MPRSFVKEARRRVGPKRARIREIIARLAAAHPDATIALKSRSPLELLVAVMLSAQTTDVNVNRVTEKLFVKYRKPEDYLAVPPEELERATRAIEGQLAGLFFRSQRAYYREEQAFNSVLPQATDLLKQTRGLSPRPLAARGVPPLPREPMRTNSTGTPRARASAAILAATLLAPTASAATS